MGKGEDIVRLLCYFSTVGKQFSKELFLVGNFIHPDRTGIDIWIVDSLAVLADNVFYYPRLRIFRSYAERYAGFPVGTQSESLLIIYFGRTFYQYIYYTTIYIKNQVK